MGQRSSTCKARLLACPHLNRRALPGGFALALPNGNYGCICVRIDVKPVIPALVYCERQVLRIDLVDFAFVKLAHVYVQGALVQLYLHGIVGDIGDGQAAFRIDAHYTRAQSQLGA